MTHQTPAQMKQQRKYHKQLFLVLAAVCCTMICMAQQPGNRSTATGRDTAKVTDVREKLIQLAMQNPNFEVADRYVAIGKAQVKKAKSSWLNIVSLNANLNEFSITPPTGLAGGALYYPRYNIGANIPLDVFSSKSNDIKVAKQNLGIAEAQKNQKFREIKAEVLTKYEDYLMYKLKLDLQNQVTQDSYLIYMQAEKDFSDGIIKQEDYNKASRIYADEKVKAAELQHNFNISKIELEKIVGVPIESVLAGK